MNAARILVLLDAKQSAGNLGVAPPSVGEPVVRVRTSMSGAAPPTNAVAP